MKRVLSMLICFSIFFTKISFGQFSESFSDGDFTNNHSWITNNSNDWIIENSSTVAGGATNSKTLKLNASEIGDSFLSIQSSSPWGLEQSWSFWIGRDNYPATAQNAQFVWLWADDADFTNPTINGYRIKLGDNTSNGDDIILQVINQGVVVDLIKDNNLIPNGLIGYGLTVYVTRTKDGKWTLYTSVSPQSDQEGVNANASPEAESIFNRNESSIPIIDTTFTNFEGGYLGFMAHHFSSNTDALKAAEFDQFTFSPSIVYNLYNWIGNISDAYHQPENWNPVREVKRTTDVLNFNSLSQTISISGIIQDVVAGLFFTENVTIIFSSSDPGKIITTGYNGWGLMIDDGSSLTIQSSLADSLVLMKNVKGEIRGAISLLKSNTYPEHRILCADSKSLSVFGTFIQSSSGNVFGTGKTSADSSVVFESGSEFIALAGKSPFGASTSTKVIFRKESWYRHRHNDPFSSSGRRYANFELDIDPSFSSEKITLTTANSDTMFVEDFVISNGEIHTNDSTGNISFKVNGNLSVGTTGFLRFEPHKSGITTIFLTGLNKSIHLQDNFFLNGNSELQIWNNYNLISPLSIQGTGKLVLKKGTLNLNGYPLMFQNKGTIQKIRGNLSGPVEDNPNLRYVFGDGVGSGIISTLPELQSGASFIEINNPDGVNLLAPVELTDTLILNLGKLFSQVNYITVGVNGKALYGSQQSFVDGKIAKITGSIEEFIFPTGQGELYKPVGIIPSTAAETAFLASYNNTPPDPEFMEGLQAISKVESWTIEREAGIGEAKVKLLWDQSSGITLFDPNDLKVAYLNNSQWMDAGNSGTSFNANSNSGYILSNDLDYFGSFTFGSVSPDVTFPVRYLTFSGKESNDKIVLWWTTAIENDNQGFEIEKSTDGIHFSSIGRVSPSPSQSYSFFDYQPDQSNYYRLKQMDFNGEFNFSNVIYVSHNTTPSSSFVWPNPINGSFQLILGEGESYVQVSVRNAQGSQLYNCRGSKGEVTVGLNLMMGEVTSGVYYFTIVTSKAVETLRVLKK